MRKPGVALLYCLFACCLFLPGIMAKAQRMPIAAPGNPVTLENSPQRDTSAKTNTSDWHDDKAYIWYKRLYSQKKRFPDTSIQFFHRRSFSRPWLHDLGNSGSPVVNQLFVPEYRVGPSLGYHVFDVYRFRPDSLRFYNTTRPYSVFSYQLGSKAEQMAELVHTQNIRPRWNFALQYRKINSPGYYRIQRTNHDLGNFTTNYQSRNQHYSLNAAIVYNKLQNDENGGIAADSFFSNERFGDRRTIPVRFQNDAYSSRRSSVGNALREFSMLVYHSYTLGRTDTLYSADSTQYAFKLVPRFGIAHRLQLGTEKYQFKDLQPDSLRYLDLFNGSFNSGDSVFMEQKWFYVDNTLMLEGFAGGEGKRLLFSAGIGNRFDRFRTEYGTDGSREDVVSNYLNGGIRKEALKPGQWAYNANALLFLTGNAAGDFLVHADIGKDLRLGDITIGFEQRLNGAPYNYTVFQNRYLSLNRSYNKESLTQLYGTIYSEQLRLNAGIRNYLLTNYIYINQLQQFEQDANAFNITQLWLSKALRHGHWVLDNELVYQQKAGDAPVNIPAVMGRHQLSLETRLFGNALKIATGIDLRWHTRYAPAAYSPFLNRFYYQDSYMVSNVPETAVFFNFKVKSFRAYVMGDQLQQLFTRNVITAPGYALQNAMIRFGFNWVMIN